VTGGLIKQFQPVNSPKITDLIIGQIREAILTGTMRPSDQLPPERELVKRFKASRIAVREALKSLEAAGLVAIRPGSGVYVTEADSKTMSDSLYSILRIRNTSAKEMTEARLIFEPQVARLAAERITEQEIEALKNNVEKTAKLLKAGHPVVQENIEFHILIAEATHNTVISLTMKTMLDVAQEMTVVSKDTLAERIKVSRHSLTHHKEILKALDKRDPQRVYELIHEHVVRIQRGLKKAMVET
jgi:GntR family transcriptional regulator, transcriptional repressor for pyruvate dehydrogenase complex